LHASVVSVALSAPRAPGAPGKTASPHWPVRAVGESITTVPRSGMRVAETTLNTCVYTARPGLVQARACVGDPGSAAVGGTIDGLAGLVAYQGRRVAFPALISTAGECLLLDDGSALTVVACENDVVPGGTLITGLGGLSAFGDLAATLRRLLFVATTSDEIQSVYVDDRGLLEKVVGTTDALPAPLGGTVAAFDFDSSFSIRRAQFLVDVEVDGGASASAIVLAE
jgi:hypothetical protein